MLILRDTDIVKSEINSIYMSLFTTKNSKFAEIRSFGVKMDIKYI